MRACVCACVGLCSRAEECPERESLPVRNALLTARRDSSHRMPGSSHCRRCESRSPLRARERLLLSDAFVRDARLCVYAGISAGGAAGFWGAAALCVQHEVRGDWVLEDFY